MRVRQWAAGVAAAVLVGSGVALAVADGASATDEGQVSTSAGGQVAAPQSRVAVAAGAIGFDDVPVGTTITDQYRARGVVFAGANGSPAPFTSPDGANPTSPVLSGSPRFVGAIAGRFVVPGTDRPAQVATFSLDVGYINQPGSVAVTVFDAAGRRLGAVSPDRTGVVRLTAAFPGASRFVVASAGEEPAGFGIDNLSFVTVRRLAALGDSYSSGEGAGAYDPASGSCHRSPLAWSRLLPADDPGVLLTGHFACSGAEADALVRSFKGEAPQLQQLAALTPAPDLVTLTVGGNELGFADILTSCFLADCVANGRLTTAETVLNRYLPAALVRAYGQVSATVPDADVVVVGYPRLFPLPQSETTGCGWLEPAERTRLNALAADLDQVERAAAARAGVRYASVLSSLNGHELCSAMSWVYPIGLFGGQERGHPTLPGQRAIEADVRTVIDATP